MSPLEASPRQVAPADESIAEQWQRETSEPQVRGVSAYRRRSGAGWTVTVYAAEFVREEPLEARLRDGVSAALASTPGVTAVEEEDREVWFVDGAPEGRALVQRVADFLDEIQAEVRAHIAAL